MRIRPLRVEDVADAAALTGSEPAVVAHLVAHDAAGAWAADDAGTLAGVVLSTRRDLLWSLSALAVVPAAAAVGPVLLDAALAYSRGCLRGLGVLPDDPGTARWVRMAGFALHPTMRLAGQVDRSALPLVGGVRAATPADRALVESVDRQVRGAARGPDHEMLEAGSGLLVCDVTTGSGYAYHRDGSPMAIAATTREVARRLLWSVLARSAGKQPVEMSRLSAEQDWAVDVGLTAGLGVHAGGFLALRHLRPPVPYLPSRWLG
ncbi:MAG: GNAT family N-acetyltransferase [Jiangellaceae bacterium]